MSASIKLRHDYVAAELRDLARHSGNPKQARRFLSLAAIYDGMNRRDAARIGGMDRQTLRDWVHRFNEDGPAGLIDRKPTGGQRRLTPEQMLELKQLVDDGPDPDVDGVVRWRQVDLKHVIEDRFGAVYCERSVGKLLSHLGFVRLSPRPQHPRQDAGELEAFKKTSSTS